MDPVGYTYIMNLRGSREQWGSWGHGRNDVNVVPKMILNVKHTETKNRQQLSGVGWREEIALGNERAQVADCRVNKYGESVCKTRAIVYCGPEIIIEDFKGYTTHIHSHTYTACNAFLWT